MKNILLLFILALIGGGLTETLVSEDDVTELMLKHVTNSLSRDESLEFKRMLPMIAFPEYVQRRTEMRFTSTRATLLCVACRSAASTVLTLYGQGASLESLLGVMINLCVTLNLQPEHVCREFINLHAAIVQYILDNQPDLQPRSICGMFLQSEDPNACPYVDERYEWTVDIPPKNDSLPTETPASKDEATFRVAHITDTHYDPVYEPGGLAACDEATCCRRGQSIRESPKWRSKRPWHRAVALEDFVEVADAMADEEGNLVFDLDKAEVYAEQAEIVEAEGRIEAGSGEIPEEDRAGYWGDYRSCDSPWWAFEDGVDHIAENQEFDYIYFTGDVIDHGVWETSEELITESLNLTFIKLKAAFQDTPIFPVIGNHESQPLNHFAPITVTPANVSTAWLYNLLNDLWSDWLPEDTRETILAGGYYTVLVKPGFRIVTLNSNLCYVYNGWLQYEPKDPSGQLAWLVQTLLKAEAAREIVHILSHAPTGSSDYYYVCAREYTRILRRFSNIIRAEFNGHTHTDEFKVFYGENGTDPFAVAWNGGSLTAYSYVNPNYRIYEVNGETYELVDAHTWSYNLSEANLTPDQRPRWFKLYSMREHYNTTSLSAREMGSLIERMVTKDRELLFDYQRFRTNGYLTMGNSTDVKRDLCYMTRTALYDGEVCDRLWQVYNQTMSDSDE